jgi:hypothetical protein
MNSTVRLSSVRRKSNQVSEVEGDLFEIRGAASRRVVAILAGRLDGNLPLTADGLDAVRFSPDDRYPPCHVLAAQPRWQRKSTETLARIWREAGRQACDQRNRQRPDKNKNQRANKSPQAKD